jgi:putative FmdB family regulatory protein
MPLYTYTCLECKKTHEVIQSIEQRDNSLCPDCGLRLVRNIDKPGLVWAPTRGGSGYAT